MSADVFTRATAKVVAMLTDQARRSRAASYGRDTALEEAHAVRISAMAAVAAADALIAALTPPPAPEQHYHTHNYPRPPRLDGTTLVPPPNT